VIVLALITGASVWGVLSYQHAREQESERTAAAESDTARVQQQCAFLATFEALIECVAEEARAERADQQAQADLRAQNEMASWAFGLFVFAILAFVTGGFGVILLLLNLWQIEEQSRHIREQFIAENRPWLKVKTSLSEASVAEKKEPKVFVKVEFENIGQSPAYRVYVSKQLQLCDPSEEPAEILQRSMREYRLVGDDPGFSMLPRDRESSIFLLRLTRDGDSQSPAQNKHLIGWIAYRFSPNGEIHFTPISQSVFWLASEGDDVNVEDVRLSPSALGIGPD
jgi:hypothetical protein